MELHFLNENSAYFDGAVNLGLLVRDKKALLVDSGLDSSVAKKVIRILKEKDIIPLGLILTHAHADHTGGAGYLRETLNIPVMASALEKPFIENPQFEPFYLFGGSQPLKAMENKFLKAPPCPVDTCLDPGKQEILGFSLEITALPGHSPGQIGIIYENTFFTADALFSTEALTKHGIPYFVDIDSSFRTIEFIASCSNLYRFFIPSHSSCAQDINVLAAANKKCLDDLLGSILEKLSSPLTTSDLLSLICLEKGLVLDNPSRYYLNQAGLHSLLSYLTNKGQIKINFENNLLLWSK